MTKKAGRWLHNGPYEKALTKQFQDGDVVESDLARDVYKNYGHLYSDIKLENFRKHFNRIRKAYLDSLDDGGRKKAAGRATNVAVTREYF